MIWGELPNGLRYALLPTENGSSAASLRLIVKAGADFDPPGKQGLAHYLEHLAFASADSLEGKSLFRFLSENGMSLDAHANGRVGPGHTVYELDFIRSSPARLRIGLSFFADILDGLRFDPRDLEIEKRIVANEILERDGLADTEVAKLRRMLFDNLPDDETDVAKQQAALAGIGVEDAQDFWNSWYNPRRATIFIVGDIDKDSILSLLEERFGPIENKPEPKEPVVRRIGKNAPRGGVKLVRHDAQRSAAHSVSISETIDFYDPQQERWAANMALLALKAQLSINADHPFEEAAHHLLDNRLIIDLNTAGPADDLPLRIFGADKALHKIHGIGVGEREWQLFILRYSTLIRATDASSPQKEWPAAVADWFAESLVESRPFRTGKQKEAFHLSLIEGLDWKEATKLYREHFDPKLFQIVAIAPEDNSLPIGKINKNLKIARKQYGQMWPDVAPSSPDWQSAAGKRQTGSIKTFEESSLGELTLYRYTLENGLRLNLAKTSAKTGTFRARVSIGNGTTGFGESSPSASWLARAMLRQMRIGESKETPGFLEALSQLGLVGIDIGADLDSAFIKVTGDTHANQREFFSLLARALEDPKFDKLEFDNWRHSIRAIGAAFQANDPRTQLESLLFLEEPRLRNAYLTGDADSLEFESFSDWLSTAMKAGYLELTIVGDVEARDTLRHIVATVGALPARTGALQSPSDQPDAAYGAPGAREGSYRSESDLAYLSFYWPLGATADCRTAAALDIVRSALSSYLHSQLREESALVYSIDLKRVGDTMAPKSDGLRADFRTSAARAQSLKEDVLEIVGKFHSAADWATLEDASDPTIDMARELEKRDDLLLSLLAQSQGRPTLYDCYRLWRTDSEIDLAACKELAETMLDPANARIAIVRPAPRPPES